MKRFVFMIIPALNAMRIRFFESAKCVVILLVLAVVTAGCTKTIPANDENGEEPQVSNVDFTPCQQTIAKSTVFSDRVEVEFATEGIQITYYNFEVTCDFTTVNVTHTFVNGFLNITQQGFPNQAKCVCYTDVSYSIRGISQNEVNVIFINGVQVYCYNDKDNTPQVQVSNVTFTECINTALYLPPAIFTVDFTNLGVNITHYLLDVNCAFNTVLVTKTFENRILKITEQGYPNSANCICKTNVSYTIEGISEKDIDKIVINGEVAWTANQKYSNCDKDVIISKTEYENAPNDFVVIENLKIEGNCLKIKYSASGCSGNSWIVELIDSGNVYYSIATAYYPTYPPKRILRLSLDDREECEAWITQEMSFNIEDLQVQEELINKVILDISGKTIVYEY